MRRLTLGILLLLLFGVASVGTGVVLWLLTTPETRASARFIYSCGALLLAGALSTAYGLVQIAARRERAAPLPAVFSLATAIFFYDLFVVAAALLAWIAPPEPRVLLALHVGGFTVAAILAVASSMFVTKSSEERDDRKARTRMSEFVAAAEEASRALAACGSAGAAAGATSLAEELRYADPVSVPAVRAEDAALDEAAGSLLIGSRELRDALPDARQKVADALLRQVEETRTILRRRNAKLRNAK